MNEVVQHTGVVRIVAIYLFEELGGLSLLLKSAEAFLNCAKG
jgi:hypothetical protein